MKRLLLLAVLLCGCESFATGTPGGLCFYDGTCEGALRCIHTPTEVCPHCHRCYVKVGAQ